MRSIVMNVQRLGNKGWVDDGQRTFNRTSRWIKVQEKYNPCSRNSLWDYVQDEYGYKPYDEQFNPTNGLYLTYFRYKGRNYAVEQFWCLGNPFYMPVTYSYEDKAGRVYFLGGVDMDGDLYHPIYIEWDEFGSRVRVYEEA